MQIDSSNNKKKGKAKKNKQKREDDEMEEADQVGELPEPTISEDKNMKGKQIWNEQTNPLQEGEEMDFDSAAY